MAQQHNNSLVQYPFVGVAGQTQFKTALILLVINPVIGGVLISGPRGSAKTTLARGLADLLSIKKSPEESSRFVNLPLGASEEMLVGSLDLQQVLDEQKVVFKQGLLAKANGGVLYVDEVNLLPDPLVDLLLDVSASGVNHIERDGVSHVHDARFLLIGTMNPDEGELRPQLHDRFSLAVELDNQYSIEERMEIVQRREAFDNNPELFCQQYKIQQQELLQDILKAQKTLDNITFSDELRTLIAERCHAANVDGLRADIIWYRSAIAHTAWSGRNAVSEDDINAVEEFVLCHRRKQSKPPATNTPPKSNFSASDTSQKKSLNKQQADSDWGSMEPVLQKTGESQYLNLSKTDLINSTVRNTGLDSGKSKGKNTGRSKRSHIESNSPNWFRTLLSSSGQWPPQKIKFNKSYNNGQFLHLILLDTSASTLANNLYAQAKGVVLGIAEQAYLAREQLAILGFGNQQIQSVLPRARAPKQLRKLLDTTSAGGGTPLREVLLQAKSYYERINRQFPSLQLRTYLITDGRSTQNITDIHPPGEWVLVDIEQSVIKRGRGREIAESLNADYYALA